MNNLFNLPNNNLSQSITDVPTPQQPSDLDPFKPSISLKWKVFYDVFDVPSEDLNAILSKGLEQNFDKEEGVSVMNMDKTWHDGKFKVAIQWGEWKANVIQNERKENEKQ